MTKNLLRKASGDSSEVEAIIAEMIAIGDALERTSFVAPDNIAEMLDTIAANPGEFFIDKRHIRPALGAYEMVVSVEPSPSLRAFMTTLRAWVAESDIIDVFDVAG